MKSLNPLTGDFFALSLTPGRTFLSVLRPDLSQFSILPSKKLVFSVLRNTIHRSPLPPRFSKELPKKPYTHHDYQDEFLQIIANQVFQKNLTELKNSNFYSIMCDDEYTDISNNEQLLLYVHWVDDNLEAHENFLGFYQITNIKSGTIVSTIKDALIKIKIQPKALESIVIVTHRFYQ